MAPTPSRYLPGAIECLQKPLLGCLKALVQVGGCFLHQIPDQVVVQDAVGQRDVSCGHETSAYGMSYAQMESLEVLTSCRCC